MSKEIEKINKEALTALAKVKNEATRLGNSDTKKWAETFLNGAIEALRIANLKHKK